MDPVFAPDLTTADAILLRNLVDDVGRYQKQSEDGHVTDSSWGGVAERDARDLGTLKALNDPKDNKFEPSIFTTIDAGDISSRLPAFLHHFIFRCYVPWARKIVRHETDVIMLTHLILYFTTLVPSAVFLFYRFSYIHAVLHSATQVYLMGTYTLMMHQHIHMRGILAKTPGLRIIDTLFPYLLDPLMGHTWNSYFYHHVKHHHVESNGPDDLSSTMNYQRDSVLHFLCYVGRFVFFIWLDLPLYFLRKGRTGAALKAGLWEFSDYAMLYTFFSLNRNATIFTLLLPLVLLRLGLMIGNWGQHAFVDADEPGSDFRSSITLIDVASNRFCYNDGYHTSHHLNPLRHWRDHPVSFLEQKAAYANEHALVFHNIDFFMLTVRLLMKDYNHLVKCLVPVGDQMNMSTEERIEMLKSHCSQFTMKEARAKITAHLRGKVGGGAVRRANPVDKNK